MTPEQKDQVLAAIADHADTLNKLLMVQQTTTDDWASRVLTDAAQSLAQMLGAMAEDAVTGGAARDMHRWFYGPIFNSSGVKP